MNKENTKLWDEFADIDPKFTKKITGRDYGGTSPNPQYVIRCLTELFGPVGKGFGWRVISEGFKQLGETNLHWCRIEFWHSNRENKFEEYGQTKVSYTTSKGYAKVDEDAPKKSLTDAVIKAASHLGIASNIFLGRWDDQKYVQQVAKDFEEKGLEKDIEEAVSNLESAETLSELRQVFTSLTTHIRNHDKVVAAKDSQKQKLKNTEK